MSLGIVLFLGLTSSMFSGSAAAYSIALSFKCSKEFCVNGIHARLGYICSYISLSPSLFVFCQSFSPVSIMHKSVVARLCMSKVYTVRT